VQCRAAQDRTVRSRGTTCTVQCGGRGGLARRVVFGVLARAAEREPGPLPALHDPVDGPGGATARPLRHGDVCRHSAEQRGPQLSRRIRVESTTETHCIPVLHTSAHATCTV